MELEETGIEVRKILRDSDDEIEFKISVKAKEAFKSFLQEAVAELVEEKVQSIVTRTIQGVELGYVIEDRLEDVMKKAMDEVMGNMRLENFDQIKKRQKIYEERQKKREEALWKLSHSTK